MTSTEAFDLTSRRIHDDPLSPIRLSRTGNTTDILIIGSGITSCSIARHVLALTPSSSSTSTITLLEARTLCSGATGRNGGAIATHPVTDYAELVDVVGKEEAAKILRFRLARYGMIYAEMEALGKDALERSEVRKVQSCVGFVSEEKIAEMKKALARMEEDLPEHKGRVKIYSKPDPEFKTFEMSGVAGLSVEPNGAIWPYRMITQLFTHLLSTYPSRLTIKTRTPALSIVHTASSTHPYTITTSRGTINAKHLIHATNGHTGHLLPSLRSSIFPVKGHMSVQRPGPLFPILNPQTTHPPRSWSIVYDSFGLDYITQNPHTYELWYGGGLVRGSSSGLSALGDADDSTMDPLTLTHLHAAAPIFFGPENWGSEKEGEERLKAEWSGIMGFTADELPLVGRLPESATVRKEMASTSLLASMGMECQVAGEAERRLRRSWCLVKQGKSFHEATW